MITLLHEFTLTTVLVRLLLAVASAGVIGMDRSYKKREAGLHTYMLISLGAAMTIMIGIYEYEMLMTQWADAVQIVGMKYDVSRFGAQVLSGIGFLGPAFSPPPVWAWQPARAMSSASRSRSS